jgi:hypothetical protein
MELGMRVSIFSDDGARVWEYAYSEDGQSTGFVIPSALRDAATALRIALGQVYGRLGCPLQEIDAVSDIRAAARQVERHIPEAGLRYGNLRRETGAPATIMIEGPTAPIISEVDVVHHVHVALVRRVDNDNISGT